MMTSFVDKLKQRLELPLPGLVSHQLMRPLRLDGNKIRFQNSSEPRPGAVLILFYEKDGDIYFPLIQRPVYDGVHSGQIALPGGKKEPGDHSLFETALRESYEEIGIVVEKVEILGALSSFLVAASNHEVLPVIGYYPEEPVYYPDHVEVDEVITASLDDLLDDSRVKRTTINVGNQFKLDSPYFDLQDKVVWGATAGILSELKIIIKEIEHGFYKNP